MMLEFVGVMEITSTRWTGEKEWKLKSEVPFSEIQSKLIDSSLGFHSIPQNQIINKDCQNIISSI